MMGPNDPKPSVKVENGKIVEMDGKKLEDFDLIDLYIAKYGINIDNVEKVMNMDSTKIARMLVDPNVSRDEIIEITSALTPAKAEEIISKLDFGDSKTLCRYY